MRLKDYTWGENDCMTFITRWHDKQHKTATTYWVKNKYSDKTGAIEYLQTVDNPTQWLPRNGYKQVNTHKTGDVLINKHDGVETGWLFCNGLAYTFSERGLIATKPKFEHTIWRHAQ